MLLGLLDEEVAMEAAVRGITPASAKEGG